MGLDIQVINREVFDPVLMGMELLSATMKFHPGKFEPTMRLLGSDEVLAKLKAGASGREIVVSARAEVEQFRRIRSRNSLPTQRPIPKK